MAAAKSASVEIASWDSTDERTAPNVNATDTTKKKMMVPLARM
jgi:hypothetical protein